MTFSSDATPDLWRDRAKHSAWFETIQGESYVALAFEYAAQAAERFCPDVKLYYNDYRIEDADKRSKVITMVRQLRQSGVREVHTPAHFRSGSSSRVTT